MSHRLCSAILLAFALFTCPASAQNTGPSAPNGGAQAAPTTNNAGALTPEQAKQALDTLQDDKKRALIRCARSPMPRRRRKPRRKDKPRRRGKPRRPHPNTNPQSRSRLTALVRSCF